MVNLKPFQSFFKIIKRSASTVKRKYPLDPNHAKDIPIFQYPVSKPSYNRVYVWGSTKTGALGVPFYKQDRYRQFYRVPKRLGFAEKFEVTTAACGYGFTVYAVNSDNYIKLYGTGLNCDGQIGHHEIRSGHPLETIFFPQPISLPFKDGGKVKILKLAAGRAHLLVLTNEGLFTLGNNSYGQCGRTIIQDEDYFRSSHVNHIRHVDGKEIVDVTCGQDHSLVLTEDGCVYSCGCGTDGQTGLGHYETSSKFTKLEGDIKNEKITKLACIADFVLALNDKGEVFGWGNNEYSQLNMIGQNTQQQNVPVHIKKLNEHGRIKDVATGGTFCSVINDNGDLLVWGYGLLGLGPKVNHVSYPVPIPSTLFGKNAFQPDVKVESVTCGVSHIAAVTNKGDLYTWGRNKNCCLGLGNDKDVFFPLKVAIGGTVKQAFCGFDHMVVICKPFV